MKQTYSTEKALYYADIVETYADYMISEIEAGKLPSVRSVEKHFKELGNSNYIRSHVTIYKLLTEVLPIVNYEKYLMIKNLFEKNNDRKKGIEENKIRIRVFQVISLYLKGFTIEQIVDFMNDESQEDISFDTIYRDINLRFVKIAQNENLEDLYKKVQLQSYYNRMSNLSNKNSNNCFDYEYLGINNYETIKK